MLQLTYPGVYPLEKSSGVRTIVGASTSIAHFIGPTKTGIENRPVRCLNYGDFERQFGGLHPTSSLSYSVLHFFANGGSQAFVTKLPVKGADAASLTLPGPGEGLGASKVTLTALGSGAAGNGIFVEVDPFGLSATAFPNHDPQRFNLTIIDSVTGLVERFGDLTTDAGHVRNAVAVVNDPNTGSKLVSLRLEDPGKNAPHPSGAIFLIGKPPAGGEAPEHGVTVKVSIIRLDAVGSDVPAISSEFDVTVFPEASPLPATPRGLLAGLVAAINAEIGTSEDVAAKLAGAEVHGELVEGGKAFVLTLTRPTSAAGPERVHDARIELRDVGATAQDGSKFRTTYGLGGTDTSNQTQNDVANTWAYQSRYRLGGPVGSGITADAGADGEAHGQPDSTDFKDAVTAIEARDPYFNLLCLPDLARPSATDPTAAHHTNAAEVYAEAARVCGLKFAFLLVDPPPNVVDVGAAEDWKANKMGFASSHAGAWFPRIRVSDPLQPGAIISHPPSGAMAGVIARTDSQVGVWQAPAGTDATLAGVYGPAVAVSDPEHGLLNPLGLNVIRQFPIYQTVGFGSRTVDGANALGSEWKYIPVRRTADYILRSLTDSLRWAVHKPNGEELWSQLRVSVTAFMHGLFRQGAFKGTSAKQAYFVACDASTTTADDINLGVVNIAVGFAPLKPAEFVVVTLRQIVQPAA